jgi:biopolymer transport protein ExbB
MWQLVSKGGWLMIPIGLCSFFSIAIILERLLFYFFNISRFNTRLILSRILECVHKNKITEAIDICEKNPYHITNILKSGLIHYNESKEIIKESMENASLYELPKLERRLNYLSTIAHISPLLGLLGTVVGLVKCFNVIEKKASIAGVVNPSDLAGGISEALLTTVAGLIVAILAYIAYNYFVHRVNYYVFESERAATELLEVLFERRYVDEI